MEDNYFVCTLGQAKHHPRTNASSIPEFLELQAERHGQKPAVGFPGLAENSTSVLNFHNLNEQTKQAARGLATFVPKLKEALGQGRTAALLAHSHVVFLKVWLGLIRLGFSVLLLAPQLDQASIEHLCEDRYVELLLHDSEHANKARDVKGVAPVLIKPDDLTCVMISDAEIEIQIGPQGKLCSVPYLHHSSGTSSGKPKAIPQSNTGAFLALPSMDMSSDVGTFSSTPLYHGGVADCFRAWTSGQMIWLFPGGEKPITAKTVLACLSVAEEHSLNGSVAPTGYFSSVPYVLRDLAANNQGMAILRQMDIVGVGGAAFPPLLGQKLVSEGISLVSRYGSAECGFLLSSYRGFEKDKDWDYLRSDTGAEHLVFEAQENGLFELIVKPGWPHIAKSNRDDGSYATADLLEQHPTKPTAWRYHSRADAQITLVNGKKFDPEPIESAIVSKCHSKRLLDVLIFGDGESYPGALIFASIDSDSSAENFFDQIWTIMDEVNQKNPSHARLSKDNIRVITHQNESVSPLEKSSKGTILRGKASERYHDHICQIYEGQPSGSELEYSINSRSELAAAIIRIIERTTNKCLAHNDDFFENGIDSVACIQIRKAIQNLITSTCTRLKANSEKSVNGVTESPQSNFLETSTWFRNGGELPNNLLYDCGTVDTVASFLLGEAKSALDNDHRLMKEFAMRYSNFSISSVLPDSSATPVGRALVILLTGATGALGTHLLDVLRSDPNVKRIYCLLRASDPFVAHQRVEKALRSKAKEGLQSMGTVDKKVVCIPCDLAQPNLGMDEAMLRVIRSSVDMIIHAAWAVNFTLRLQSFQSHLAGVQNLLRLGFDAAQGMHTATPEKDYQRRHVKFVLCSSTASISSSRSASIEEKISTSPSEASPLGYSRSKWVAESICASAHKATIGADIPLDIQIIRIGQLCGDTENGIWNKTEAWPLMLSTYDLTGSLPDLPHEKVNWLPLDVAANSICEISFDYRLSNREEDSSTEPAVYHVLNPHFTPSWRDMLRWLHRREGEHLRIIEPTAWLRLLEECLIRRHPDHPSRKLIGLWKDNYLLSRDREMTPKPEFEIRKAAGVSAEMGNVVPLSRELMEKMWIWIRRSMKADGEKARP
jgi:thioester reductase-like protein